VAATAAFNNLLIHKVQIVIPLAEIPRKTAGITAAKGIRQKIRNKPSNLTSGIAR
jgi:hypothetical protein